MRAEPLVDPAFLRAREAEGLWNRTTLWHEVSRHDPDKVAVVCPRRGPVTFGQLRAEAEGLAAVWYAQGLQPGEVVAWQLPNWYESALVHLALTRLGAVSMGLLPTFREREIAFVAERAAAAGLVVAAAHRSTPDVDTFERLVATVPSLRWYADVDGDPPLTEVAAGGDPSVLPEPPDPDDITILMATSGTTGEPKIVMHSHRSTVGGVLQHVAEAMTLSGEDVFLMPSAVGHASGLQYGLRMAGVLGATLVLQDRWNPAECADLIERHGVTWMMGATPFLFDLLQLPEEALGRLATLRVFTCGGAPIPESLAKQATERLPDMALLACWGMSETGIATLVHPGDPPEKVTGSDGRPVRGWEFRIVDPATGRDVGPGEEGEILCRGSALFHGYLGRPDFTAEAAGDGWLRTGDLGRMDEDGYLRCLGRIKDLIIRGGFNISAVEVEDAVRTHPAVHEVAVVGTPDERLGERICAVIVPSGTPPTVEDLAEHLLARGFSKLKLPERVVIVDQLPMTLTGKIQKFKLREALASGAS